MIILLDADSLVFASCYNTGSEDIFYTDLEDSVSKFDEQFMAIINEIEKRW